MNVLLDTNILLDVLANRTPFYQAAAEVWSLAERKEIVGFISAISFNNVYYIVRKAAGRAKADRALALLRDVFEIVTADSQIINQAMDAKIDDFEDAIQYHSALRSQARYLITRDPSGYPASDLAVVDPLEFMSEWRAQN